MKSPPVEWTLLGAYAVILDVVRAKGEADHDTLSECVRNVVARHPLGPHAFAAGLALGAVALHRHIVGPLTR